MFAKIIAAKMGGVSLPRMVRLVTQKYFNWSKHFYEILGRVVIMPIFSGCRRVIFLQMYSRIWGSLL